MTKGIKFPEIDFIFSSLTAPLGVTNAQLHFCFYGLIKSNLKINDNITLSKFSQKKESISVYMQLFIVVNTSFALL